ncbi:CDP-glucose 4,6-dehydratase [Methylobacterium durans]|uniref:CDP-glucose 4,6-dehydratase n=1 Tax=Methylobacterium durans TaxID=2202825 RepID=UPI002AFE2917|nr:CDP-glucose 4,6-dehydratase [Methylobacterium durans]MEA1835254.1 CDP-glucose 4,6-dehydratase [Methylobacterium durans]
MAPVVNRDFWHGRRVFVTGHTGFKGSWLTLILSRLGACATGYSLEPVLNPNMFAVAQLHDQMHNVYGDINDRGRLAAAMRDAKPDVVLHMAAQPLVRAAYQDPVATFADNVMGTVHVLDAIRTLEGVRSVIIVTTDKCYENREWDWGYREIDGLGGRDPYSSSKACAELVSSAFRESYFPTASHAQHGVGVASVRAGNVIGGGDWAEDRLIPDIVRAASLGKSLEIRSPGATRPWQHVLEPLAGYLTLAERLYTNGPEFAQAWNFGPDSQSERTVAEVLDGFVRRWPDGVQWHTSQTRHPHEARYLKLDCAKSRSRLGWTPKLSFEDALDLTAAWYLAHANGADMQDFTSSQIADYFGQ